MKLDRTMPNVESHTVTPDLVRVLAVVGRTYEPEGVALWWNRPNAGLWGESPSLTWEYGDRNQVRRIAYKIEAD